MERKRQKALLVAAENKGIGETSKGQGYLEANC
jgi:hypothetical protein